MPLGGDGSLDQRRVCKPSGSEIDDGYRNGHADTTDEVARPLPDIEALPAAVPQVCLELAAAGLKMAEKASKPF